MIVFDRDIGFPCTLSQYMLGFAAQAPMLFFSDYNDRHETLQPSPASAHDLLRMWHNKIEGWILEPAYIDFVPVQADLRRATAA
ncbi:MAG: hypothetical protein ABIO19_01400 [Burkholderiaceae bacterium]